MTAEHLRVLMAMRIPERFSSPARIDRVLGLLDPTSGDVLLDVGCGDGRLLEAAARRRPRIGIVGVELDARLAAVAADRLRVLGGVVVCGPAWEISQSTTAAGREAQRATLAHCCCDQSHWAAVVALLRLLPLLRASFVGA